MDSLPISVIIPVKNMESTIEKCLNSVQKNNPAEIIVVDGNSVDRTVGIARRYTDKIYSDGGRGFNHAQQLGAERASQEYIAFVDADIVLPARTLATLLAELRESGRVSMQAKLLATNLTSYWERATDWHWRSSEERARGGRLSAAVLRRDTVLKYNLDSSVGVGSDSALRLMVKRDGYKLGTSSSAFAYHHHSVDLKGVVKREFRIGQEASLFIRGYGPWHVGFWSPLVALYWIMFSLIKGKLNFIPYFVVIGIVETAGMVKGFFGLRVTP